MFKKIIFAIFFLIIILLITIILWLKHGIAITNLNLNGVKIENLYLKLNNNLILNLDLLEIPKSKTTKSPYSRRDLDSSRNKILNLSKKISLIDKIFEKIDIKNLKIGDESIEILFTDEIFYVQTPIFKLNTKISQYKNGLNFTLNEAMLKDFNLTINGNGSANLRDDIYTFDGKFISHELDGKAKFRLNQTKFEYELNDVKAQSLKNFMDELGVITGLNEEVKSWIFGKIVADEYWIKFLRGDGDTNDKISPSNIEAFGIAKNLNIKFQSNLPAAIASESNITLIDGNLDFALEKPLYQGKKLDGSSVRIYDIFGEKPGILLKLQTAESLGYDLIEILKSYGISQPVYQLNGGCKANFTLDMNFIDLSPKIEANVELKNANFAIASAKFHTKSANVHITQDKINIKNGNISNEIFNATTDGVIDLKNFKAKFDAQIHDFDISPGGAEILKFQNVKDFIELDFSHKVPVLSSRFLNAKMHFADPIIIESPSIAEILPFSKLLKTIGIKDGDIKISTKNFTNLDINSKNLKFDLGLLKKDKTPYNSDSLNLKIAGSSVSGTTGLGFVNFKIAKDGNFINIKNLDYTVNSENASKESKSDEKSVALNFTGENSSIIVTDMNKTLDFSHYSGKSEGKNLELKARFKQGELRIKSKKSLLQVFADNLSADEVNALIGSKSFAEGVFSLKMSGINARNYRGEILVENTFLKDYVLYQKLLSFLNSVPSLLTFKTPDFNDKGFTVKDGKIYFRRAEDVVVLSAMNFVGTSADIGGKGEINFKNKNLNIDLEIRYLKDASSILSKIPLLNHIILGDDKSISTVIEIRGTMDKPTYKNAVITDILSTPFNIIKNTLTLPFAIFGKDEK